MNQKLYNPKFKEKKTAAEKGTGERGTGKAYFPQPALVPIGGGESALLQKSVPHPAVLEPYAQRLCLMAGEPEPIAVFKISTGEVTGVESNVGKRSSKPIAARKPAVVKDDILQNKAAEVLLLQVEVPDQ